MKRWMGWCVVLLLVPVVGAAADDLKSKADGAWAGRENPAQTMMAIQLYEQLATQNPSDPAVRIRLATAVYWAVEQDPKMPSDKQVAILEKGIKACRQILAKDENHVEANYWLMWDLAAETLAKGVFSGFAFKEAIVGTIMVAKGNVKYWYGGVYCYWARVIYEIPGLLGKFFHFTDDDSIWLYKHSIAIETRYLKNHFFLAETYQKAGRKEDARKEYQFCLNQPDYALPEVTPENRFYKKLAKEGLAKL